MNQYNYRGDYVVHNDEFPISPYTKYFLDSFPDVEEGIVLDFGCGSGILSIEAYFYGAKIVQGVDTNKNAILISNQNIERLSYRDQKINEKVSFDNVIDTSLKFTHIISNPASFPNITEHSYSCSGELGLNMIMRLMHFASKLLTPYGKLYFTCSSLSPYSLIFKELNKRKFDFEIKTRRIAVRDFYDPILNWSSNMKTKYNEIYWITKDTIIYEDVFFISCTKYR
ncbi:methyltransferase [Flavobacteriaceae bacterium M23B6Z8]